MIIIDELDRKLYGGDIKKIYGPYGRKEDARSHIVIQKTDRNLWTVSYPKYLMERQLGRRLEKDETVDHINNILTDKQENLQLLSRGDNIRKSQQKHKPIHCFCGKEFKPRSSTQKYCSNSCRYEFADTHPKK